MGVYLKGADPILFANHHRNVTFCLSNFNLFILLYAGLVQRNASLSIVFVFFCPKASLEEPNLGDPDLVFLTCLRVAVICDFDLKVWRICRVCAFINVVLARSLTIQLCFTLFIEVEVKMSKLVSFLKREVTYVVAVNSCNRFRNE